jgi:hypothetical protein
MTRHLCTICLRIQCSNNLNQGRPRNVSGVPGSVDGMVIRSVGTSIEDSPRTDLFQEDRECVPTGDIGFAIPSRNTEVGGYPTKTLE